MIISAQINEISDTFRAELDAHPECRADLSAEAALNGTPYPHATFSLGRFPDIEQGEGKPAAPPPLKSPEQRLLEYLQEAVQPVKMLNPIIPVRGLGKGTGTLAASFGIYLNPELEFTPDGYRPLAEVLQEDMPDAETSGILQEMRDDIEVTKALTPSWLKIKLPDMQGPFNIAHMILGDDAFMAPHIEPDKWKKFMKIITEFSIAVHRTLTRWIGTERLYTHPNNYHRIAECSVNMVSKEFYLDHILEYDQCLVDYYGEVAIHPCSGPHVFKATLDNLENVIYTEAGNMISPMTAGSIKMEEALEIIGARPIMLCVGEELPEGEEEVIIRRLFNLAAGNQHVCFHGFTGLGWKKGDELAMRNLHQRMNDYYTKIIEGGKLPQ